MENDGKIKSEKHSDKFAFRPQWKLEKSHCGHFFQLEDIYDRGALLKFTVPKGERFRAKTQKKFYYLFENSEYSGHH